MMRTRYSFSRFLNTLGGRMSGTAAAIVTLIIVGGVLTGSQLHRISVAMAEAQASTRYLQAALTASQQASRLVVITHQYITEERNPDLVISAIAPTLLALQDQRSLLKQEAQALPVGDALRTRMETVVTALGYVTDVTSEIVRYISKGNRAGAKYLTTYLTTNYRLVEMETDAFLVLAQARYDQAQTEFRLAMRRLIVIVPLVALLVISIAGGVTAASLRGIVAGIGVLSRSAQRLAGGHLEERVPERGVEEIRFLARTFNDMAAELQQLYAGLERLVAQRTAELARRTAQLEAASYVARRAAEIRDLDTLLDETVRLISDRFGFYHAGIFLVDEAREYAVLRAASSEGGQRMLARGHRLAVGEVGIVGYVAGTGKPRIALDVGEDAVFFSNPDLPHTRSEMALPLKVGERVIGVLDVQSEEPAAFTEEDVSVLQTLADQVALAIENARLLQETQDRLREVEALTGQAVRAGWQQMASARPGLGYIYDGVEVRPKEQASLPEETALGLTLPLQLTGGEMVGRVVLAFSDRSPADEEVALARAVAEQAALALESARLFQETRRTLAEMEAMYRASQVISTASTPDEVLRAFVDHVVPPQMDRCALVLRDPESPPEEPVVEVVAAWDREKGHPPSLGSRWSVSQIPFIGRRVTEPVVVPDVNTYPDADEVTRYVFRHVLGVRALLAIPLMIGQQPMGWLLVESLSGPYEFSEREIRLYQTLADQAALALERMRLFEETRRRAEWERIRAEVSARVRASTDVETILRTAVRELGRAFRAAEGVIQLHGGDGQG